MCQQFTAKPIKHKLPGALCVCLSASLHIIPQMPSHLHTQLSSLGRLASISGSVSHSKSAFTVAIAVEYSSIYQAEALAQHPAVSLRPSPPQFCRPLITASGSRTKALQAGSSSLVGHYLQCSPNPSYDPVCTPAWLAAYRLLIAESAQLCSQQPEAILDTFLAAVAIAWDTFAASKAGMVAAEPCHARMLCAAYVISCCAGGSSGLPFSSGLPLQQVCRELLQLP